MENDAVRVPTAPGLRGFAPEPAAQSQPEALVPSRDHVASILRAHLDRAQRNFILRMKPVLSPQVINARDWEDVEPCVDIGDGYPDTYWFGGMRLTWPNGRARRVFQFNECGLQVRAILVAQPSETPSDTLGEKA